MFSLVSLIFYLVSCRIAFMPDCAMSHCTLPMCNHILSPGPIDSFMYITQGLCNTGAAEQSVESLCLTREYSFRMM